MLLLEPCDLPEEDSHLSEVVIIKNREVLDLVSLFEDAYGTSHSVLDNRMHQKGDQRLADDEAKHSNENSPIDGLQTGRDLED